MASSGNWRVLGFAFLILALMKTEPACAEEASATVVEVESTAKVLDTAQLRGALETKLHTTIIGPADDRAGVAQGKLTIQLDRGMAVGGSAPCRTLSPGSYCRVV
jgi:hypothetical protein